ncbi:MAG TPA: hypothetical protein VL728_19600 [Cyclobacteriaceae bacterium]|jgi:hypothetical protein|nr:hypothetical protein [Cyclobacteriaceae bacterium]
MNKGEFFEILSELFSEYFETRTQEDEDKSKEKILAFIGKYKKDEFELLPTAKEIL